MSGRAERCFSLPPGNVAIAFSGGRTSAYMLRRILDANGPLTDRAIVSFQNTGRELPETLDFVQEVGDRWGVPIVWLEYRDAAAPADRWQRVNHNSAARDGAPFEALIRRKRYLPNRLARFCTVELKVQLLARYLQSIGWRRWVVARGLRADEPSRVVGQRNAQVRAAAADLLGDPTVAAPPSKPRREVSSVTNWHPLFDAGVTRRDVLRFWSRQPFDLRAKASNCDGCFLKSEAALAALACDAPDRAAWWARMEEMARDFGAGGGNYFNHRRPVADLNAFVEAQGDWIFDDKEYLCQATDGECM